MKEPHPFSSIFSGIRLLILTFVNILFLISKPSSFAINNKFFPSNWFKKSGFSWSVKNRYLPPVLLFNAIHGVINLYLNNFSVVLNWSLFFSISYFSILIVMLPKLNELKLSISDTIGLIPSLIPTIYICSFNIFTCTLGYKYLFLSLPF